ncbi:copper resistance protein C [Rhizocola hellebori]|uniref:Copper resistance protein C n=2 Tax=Rhizocola hellebori TaxID=1392758 RepID=A0A8J3QC62_9ACTN|nr:copper resistance protein C [Rhizocola hellebori]
MKRLTLIFAAMAGLVLTVASPALAHNTLVKAEPAKDQVMTAAPAEVKLQFLSTLKPATKLTVTGPDGASAIGAVKVEGKFISAPFTATVSGLYTVGYELVSDDGHPVKTSYTFTLQLPPPPQPTAEPVRVTEPPAASSQAVAAPEKKSNDTPWLPWIGGAAVAGLLVGGLITVLRNRRERA